MQSVRTIHLIRYMTIVAGLRLEFNTPAIQTLEKIRGRNCKFRPVGGHSYPM